MSIIPRLIQKPLFLANSRTQSAVVVSFYFLAWGFSLAILDAIYWDDWVFVGDETSIDNRFSQAGSPWAGSFHLFFGYSPSTYSLITFFSFLSVSLSFLGILRRTPRFLQFGQGQIILASIVFAVAPLNIARVSGITVISSISVALFFLAWYLLVRVNKNSIGILIVLITLFSLSFVTSSLLSFFAAPFFHKLVLEHESGRLGDTKTLISKVLIYGALPFFWAGIYFSLAPEPFGFYAGYNSFVLPLLIIFGVILLLVTLFLIWIFYKLSRPVIASEKSWAWLKGVPSQMVLASFLVVLALFPYIAVGKIPPYAEWSTRHELLLPAGISILAAAVFGALRKVSIGFGRLMAGLVVLGSMSITAALGVAAIVDWSKQEVLLDFWVSSQPVLQAKLVVVEDESRLLNLFERQYRFYEWSGHLRVSTGSNGPYALSNSESDLAALQSGFLREYSLLGSGPAPSVSQDYLLVTIRTTCSSPFEALIIGIPRCLSIEEEVLSFKN